jgi:hypothetical protein
VSIEAESAFRRSPDAEPWRLCLRDRDGIILGAGIALAGGAVLTCAHVVAKAAGFTGPTDVEITVEWVGLPDAAPTTARVAAGGWAPELPGGGADIALLETDADRPGTRLCRLPYPRNRTVHAFGFPQPHEFGIVATALLAGPGGPGDEWIQLDHAGRGRIRPGFSGAGVVDDRSGAVVGMVVTSYQDADAALAWLIPVDTLIRHVPAIADWLGPDVPRDDWQPWIGAIVIGKRGAVEGQVVDAAGKSTDDVVRSLPPRTRQRELGVAGIEHAQEPEKLLDDVVAPLVRSGLTVVLEFEDESSPTAELARQWQLDALQARVDSLAEGVAELTDREREVGEERARVRSRFVPPLPEIPALAEELALPLMVLRSSVRDQEPTRLARALHRYERKLVRSLAMVTAAEKLNRGLSKRHEQLRGLLAGYNAKAVEHGLMEDPRLVETYRAARAALDARPCDLDAAAELVAAYVAEVRRRT